MGLILPFSVPFHSSDVSFRANATLLGFFLLLLKSGIIIPSTVILFLRLSSVFLTPQLTNETISYLPFFTQANSVLSLHHVSYEGPDSY